MKCTNPFLSEPNWDWAFRKWGQPNNLGREPNGEFRYRCERCAASWVGPNGDYCQWCRNRWEQWREDERREILYPEWLDWGDTYFALDEIGQAVWEQTRGFGGDFVNAWKRKLVVATNDGLVTNDETVSATRRVKRWIETAPLKQSKR